MTIIACAALVTLAGAVLWYVLRVLRPIIELRDVTQALVNGDYSRRPTLAAPGETGRLAAAVHRLAEQLGARRSALETEEALLTALFDALNEGVLAVDGRQRVVRINATGRNLLRARTPTPFSVDQLPRERVFREALAAALEGHVTEGAETSIDDRTVALTARPLAGGGGAIIALLDLTSTRRLETVRRDFVANVSHELRTPLTVVGGFAETLATEKNLPAAQRRQFAETIQANTYRMQHIVDELLDLSRIESGGWVPLPAPVDAHAAALNAIAPSAEAAAVKGVALDVEVADDARIVYADATALRQILINLVENAVRHTAAGSILVATSHDAGAPDRRAGVWIAVRDAGVGIAPEHLPRIFERFYRVDRGRSRDAGGTGLGLAIVRHLAEAHGGRVRAESQVGQGTTVSVFFPDAVRPPT